MSTVYEWILLLLLTSLAKGPSPAVKGLSIAGLYGLGGYLTKKNEQANQGLMVGLGTSTAVTGMGLERALRTQKAIPMAVTVLGVINCAYYGRKLYDRWDLTMT